MQGSHEMFGTNPRPAQMAVHLLRSIVLLLLITVHLLLRGAHQIEGVTAASLKSEITKWCSAIPRIVSPTERGDSLTTQRRMPSRHSPWLQPSQLELLVGRMAVIPSIEG